MSLLIWVTSDGPAIREGFGSKQGRGGLASLSTLRVAQLFSFKREPSNAGKKKGCPVLKRIDVLNLALGGGLFSLVLRFGHRVIGR